LRGEGGDHLIKEKDHHNVALKRKSVRGSVRTGVGKGGEGRGGLRRKKGAQCANGKNLPECY